MRNVTKQQFAAENARNQFNLFLMMSIKCPGVKGLNEMDYGGDIKPSIKYDVLHNLMVFGDSRVGKTCILLHLTDDTFPSTHNFDTSLPSVIGVDFKVHPNKEVYVPQDNKCINCWSI